MNIEEILVSIVARNEFTKMNLVENCFSGMAKEDEMGDQWKAQN